MRAANSPKQQRPEERSCVFERPTSKLCRTMGTVNLARLRRPFGSGSKLKRLGYAGVSLCFHLLGFHFGTGVLSHGHLRIGQELPNQTIGCLRILALGRYMGHWPAPPMLFRKLDAGRVCEPQAFC